MHETPQQRRARRRDALRNILTIAGIACDVLLIAGMISRGPVSLPRILSTAGHALGKTKGLL